MIEIREGDAVIKWMKKEEAKSKESRQLKAIKRLGQLLAASPYRGKPISRKKRKAYAYYEKLYGLSHSSWVMYRVEAPEYWRLLYTVISDGRKTVVFLLDYIDHGEYNAIFGYRRR